MSKALPSVGSCTMALQEFTSQTEISNEKQRKRKSKSTNVDGQRGHLDPSSVVPFFEIFGSV